MDYKTLQDMNRSIIDGIDFSKYLNQTNDIEVIADLVGADYDGADFLPEEMEGFILDGFSDEEFGEYLEQRYGVKIKYWVAR